MPIPQALTALGSWVAVTASRIVANVASKIFTQPSKPRNTATQGKTQVAQVVKRGEEQLRKAEVDYLRGKAKREQELVDIQADLAKMREIEVEAGMAIAEEQAEREERALEISERELQLKQQTFQLAKQRLKQEGKIAETQRQQVERALELRERELQILAEERAERSRLSYLHLQILQQSKAIEIDLHLNKIQADWDRENWSGVLSRAEMQKILIEGREKPRLLMLISPPNIDGSTEFDNNLHGAVRGELKYFVERSYPIDSNLCPVEFYGRFFKRSVFDIELKQYEKDLEPIPTVVIYSDVTDEKVYFYIHCWGMANSGSLTLPWNWLEERNRLETSKNKTRDESRLIIRDAVVKLHQLLAAFWADLYYLQINPHHEVRLFQLDEDFPAEWAKAQFKALKIFQQQILESYKDSLMTSESKETTSRRTTVKPLKELNILILGETGVGKSTWINAFANYVIYENLGEAEQGELLSLIPSSFTMTDDNYQAKRIVIGKDDNECLIDGQSATQEPRVYILSNEYGTIRLIDTPGIGDTRGIEQDKKNVANILAFLSNYSEIHGICILLKPNNARLNVMFQFCIKELLTHLHRSAAQNIIFCFTNARATFYKPGDTLPALKKLLEDNPDVEISLSKQTIYCMDNESFRFLAALKNGVLFDEKDRQDYSASWDRSINETTRLLKYIGSLKPHKTQDTLTLNDARRLVVNLSRPIAEISQNIQTNIAVLEDKIKEVTSSEQSIQELLKNLYIPKINIEQKILDYPRTVCTSSKCTEVVSNEDGIKKIHYKTHCHEHCYLDGIQTDVVNNVALQNCSAMNSSKYCNVCGCSWTTHMHITYETYPVRKRIIDKSIKTQIESKEEAKREINKFIQTLDRRIEQFKKEQNFITQASAKFACFLKQNAIAPYNDALAAYLDHLIHEEQQKVCAGGGNQTLNGLQKMKREYDEQVKILEDAMKRGENQAKITPDDIKALEKKLLNLEITGADLKTVMTHATAAKSSAVAHNERQFQTRNPRRSDGLISNFANAVTNTANALWDMFYPQD